VANAAFSERDDAGWSEYEMSEARRVIDGDAALFEAAHLVADLTHIDGAVVMTSGLDLLGFGGEIAGDLPEVPQVMRARGNVLAIVVSQDGGLRFVRWHNDAVTY
jgi:hypothetical protein